MRSLKGALALAVVCTVSMVVVPGAMAGYGASGSLSDESLKAPAGVAVDQSDGSVYVASAFGNSGFASPSVIGKFDSSGAFLSSFGNGTYTGLAVDPNAPHNLYAYTNTSPPSGEEVGPPMIETYSSSGSPIGSPFEVPGNRFIYAGLASASSGNVYFANRPGSTLQRYTPIGELDAAFGSGGEVNCSGCPSPESFNFGLPFFNMIGTAVDAADNVYITDRDNDRVLKFDSSGENPSVFATGDEPHTIAINQATGEVFVGYLDIDLEVEPALVEFVVKAYDSSGAEISSFGQGVIGSSSTTPNGIAVDSTSGKVYVADPQNKLVWVFSPIQPIVTTTTATASTQTAATLNGTVNPNEGGAIISCEFEWGTTTEYTGGTVPCASNPPDGGSAVPVSGALGGLSPNTTYHYQLVVSNGGETIEGGDQTLKTLPPAPKATTEAATAMSQSAATLHATVDAEGDSATCKFEYGTTPAYGSVAPCSTTPVTGTGATAVSAALSGLSASTTYHFRVVATGKGGEAKGDDMTFATSAAPPPPPSGGGGGGSTPPPSGGGSPPPQAKKPLKCKKGFKKKTVKGKQKCVKVKKKHKKR